MGPTTHANGKPLSYPELRVRVDALLRRVDVRRRPGRLRVREREVDAAARVVRLRGATVELSRKEFALVRTPAEIATGTGSQSPGPAHRVRSTELASGRASRG